MIRILHKDTCPDIEHWEGHPCIPRRVLGPKEYLIDLPLQISKLRITSKLLPSASGESVLASQQSRSQLGSFEATRTQCGGCDLGSKGQEDATRAQFVSWFDTAFANSDPQLKQKALLASWDAASAVLVEAQQTREEPVEGPGPCRPKVTHGHPDTRISRHPACKGMGKLQPASWQQS